MKILRVGAIILLGFGAATMARAATDVGPYYWVLKRADFNQTSTANPVPAGAPFQLHSSVLRAAGGNFGGATSFFVAPASSVINTPQAYTLISDGSLQYDTYLGSQSDLDKAFASGRYDLDIRGAANEYFPTIRLDGPSSFPPEKPKISNSDFNNGQLVVKPTQALTLNWNSFASHDADDVIIFTVTQGTAIIARNVLPPTTLSKAFAANFFKAEQSYTAEISFVKVTNRNTTDIAGSIGLGGFASTTRIFISTSSRTPLNGLANISTRGLVGTGDNVLISGFIVTSSDTTPLRVVVRAIGPSLATQGIKNPLLDPTIQLFDGNNKLITSNDNWKTTTSASLITQAHLNPGDARESAILRDLAPGKYTAVVQGKNGATGIGLTEVYNLGSTGATKLANISTRGQVLTDDQVMICGVIVVGPFSHSILFRALGPSLSPAVTGVLANPTLQIVNAQGQTTANNDNWKAPQQAEIQATGLAPSDDKESAVLRTFGPGSYTAIVRGKSNGTGISLIEAYQLN